MRHCSDKRPRQFASCFVTLEQSLQCLWHLRSCCPKCLQPTKGKCIDWIWTCFIQRCELSNLLHCLECNNKFSHPSGCSNFYYCTPDSAITYTWHVCRTETDSCACRYHCHSPHLLQTVSFVVAVVESCHHLWLSFLDSHSCLWSNQDAAHWLGTWIPGNLGWLWGQLSLKPCLCCSDDLLSG